MWGGDHAICLRDSVVSLRSLGGPEPGWAPDHGIACLGSACLGDFAICLGSRAVSLGSIGSPAYCITCLRTNAVVLGSTFQRDITICLDRAVCLESLVGLILAEHLTAWVAWEALTWVAILSAWEGVLSPREAWEALCLPEHLILFPSQELLCSQGAVLGEDSTGFLGSRVVLENGGNYLPACLWLPAVWGEALVARVLCQVILPSFLLSKWFHFLTCLSFTISDLISFIFSIKSWTLPIVGGLIRWMLLWPT